MAAYTTIDKPSDYFETVLYTGDGGSSRGVTGVGFQPDWVWIKNRDQGNSHHIYDVIRGTTKRLASNNTNAEETVSNGLTAFGSDGFTVGNSGAVNGSSEKLVSWNWKAGTSVSGNTGGSGTAKTYTGSVNTDAGFSIIRYIGNSTAGHTIPHHLGTTPAWIICRTISAAKEWDVYHHKNTSSPETDYLVLNTTAATTDTSDKWNDTAPTSSVVTLGDSSQLNTNDGTCIMYAFSERKGYSKFSSYTGNGSASSGTFIYTGFKPAWVMIKSTNAVKSWMILDNKRNPTGKSGANTVDYRLRADTSETTSDNAGGMDFLSQGFKLYSTDTSTNQNGTNYIYMAFAENPFVTSTGVPACAR